ncbi:MAG: hypothetical protein ABSE73_09595 [Planctomycetota bacterium]
MGFHWREDKRQKTWLWVGLLFSVFYFTEAFLFWGPEHRVAAPPFTPLVFWGLFGVALVWVLTRPLPSVGPQSRFEKIQYWVLSVAITAATVGVPFLIICRTGDVTLGHVVLLFVLAQAALIISALAFNAGWLAAGLCWIAGGMWILCRPSGQDYVLGAALAIGFVLIGVLRKCLVPPGVEG